MIPAVTVYTSVLNEEASIRALLDSLLGQTFPPTEILVVDGGSHDRTRDIVGEYMTRDSRIRLVDAPGTNIAQARNVALANVRCDLVASIDGDCVARADWLERLVSAAAEDVDIVAGTYAANPVTDWDAVLAEFFYPDPRELPDDWNRPSHRSILIRKRAADRVGPFPAKLYRSEDSWFNVRASQLGLRFKLARDAVVHWRPRPDLGEVARNTYLWVKSDLENDVNMPFERDRAIRITLRLLGKIGGWVLWTATVAVSPLAGLLTFPLLAFHLAKVSHRMRSLRYFALYNIVDYAVMAASAWGLIQGEWVRVRRPPATTA